MKQVKCKRPMTSGISRRTLLAGAGLGALGLAIRAHLSGVPANVLFNPLTAHAEDSPSGRSLILCVSRNGDPLNANVPGTYDVPETEIFHPSQPSMAPTSLMLGDVASRAAKPWAELPQHILDRTAFIHHATYTPVHGELSRVQRIMQQTENEDMWVSILARELQAALGSIQAQPLSLGATHGGELLSAAGNLIANVSPLGLKTALGGVPELKHSQALRDTHIDALHNLFKRDGTPAQRNLLDQWARSRDEARDISENLLTRLDEIDGNNAANQTKAAAILSAMNIAPVITIHLPFGGDNHSDPELEKEATEQTQSIPLLGALVSDLDELRRDGHLKSDCLVASLNVFGRTLKKKGRTGRDHHAGHHTMFIMGNGVAPGVYGGLSYNSARDEYGSTSIDSVTGKSGGNIPFEDTLASAAKTLGALTGLPSTALERGLPSGNVIEAVIADAG